MPLKAFDSAKSRLRGSLDPAGAEALVRQLADAVLGAAQPLDTFVVCADEDVAGFARSRGAGVILVVETSLNGAVQAAYRTMGGYDQAIVVHGDLREPEGLGRFQPKSGVTVVTDHHHQGTNVLVVPTCFDFHFAYGPDSARRHQREADRLGLPAWVINDSPWRFDVDEPQDLDSPRTAFEGARRPPQTQLPKGD